MYATFLSGYYCISVIKIKKLLPLIKGAKAVSFCGTTQIDDKSSTRFAY